MEKEKLDEILKKHAAWLADEDGGERADLRTACLHDADLRYADLSYADLRYADLSDACLRGTDLRYANLCCANLSGTNLSGADLCCAMFDDHIVCLDRIGSVKRRTTYNATKDIVWCGCFRGTFEEWVAKIRETYPDEKNVYRREYEAAIAFFKAVAEANRKAKR